MDRMKSIPGGRIAFGIHVAWAMPGTSHVLGNLQKTKHYIMSRSYFRSLARQAGVPVSIFGLCMGGALAQAADATVDKLEKENQDLRKRLDALEAVAKKEGILPDEKASGHVLKAMSETTISGFVQASYFYNNRTPADGKSDGYLWNTTHNSFSLNKVKVTLASKGVERSGESWDAGYRTSLMWGEDSQVLNTGSPVAGFEAIREAFVEAHVPIGTGLNVKAGHLISLLNYESGDGGAANANFSQGYQWFYTGNGPAAGFQLNYKITDMVDVTARIQNGLYAGPVDSNNAKIAMGAIGIKPSDATWFSLIGFGRVGGQGNGGDSVRGGSLLAGHTLTEGLNLGLEFDYFSFEAKPSDLELWSIGTWITYDFTSKFGVALRAEYLDDKDGGGIKGVGLPGAIRGSSAILSPDIDGDLSSLTLTFNYKPAPNIKIQPEIRYDRTSYAGGFDGTKDRFTFGAGVSYLF